MIKIFTQGTLSLNLSVSKATLDHLSANSQSLHYSKHKTAYFNTSLCYHKRYERLVCAHSLKFNSET